MSGLTVRPVTEGTPVAGFVTELYTEAFDRRMQVPVSNLFKVSALHKADFMAVFDDDLFVGFYYVYLHGDNAFLYYLAVCGSMRCRGYGTEILDIIKDTYYPKYRIVLCTEAPLVDDKLVSSRYRRLAFYSRNGFIDTLYKFESVGVRYEVLYWGPEWDPEDIQEILRSFRRSCGYKR